MRFRSFIWPDNLPHNLICKCSREITTTHLLNCKHFITFRSKVHDAVRDQLYCMCKSHRIESFLEPLLSNLFDAENDFHKNNRGDVILPGLDGSFILLDVMSVDPCNASNERLVNSEIHNPLSNAENFKFKKYNEPLSIRKQDPQQFLLIFNSFNLDSLSGVKQGDPLGPFFFCLAIHPILKKLKEENSDLQVVAYMDDISCIGPESTINRVANEAATLYQSIGLDLNVQKCFCISRKNVKLIINSLEVPYIDYTSTSFCFLGCYLGSAEKTLDSLENYLNSIKKELEVIKALELEKHLKFFLLKICYAGKITHLLRSLPPSLTYNFCRQFNKIRTQFLAYLMSVDPSILKNHIFSDVQLGGVGFNSSKYLTKAAFIGGGKNFVFEFSRRYPLPKIFLKIQIAYSWIT
ncbi:hypothetical protein P9112_001351 [Eukaryota sp. TZLM1-RC]